MIIRKIKVCNFRSFKGIHDFKFDLINLIIGKVGSGKSTLGMIAPMFALHGYSEVPINKLPSKGVEEGETWVELMIQDKGSLIMVKREIPTKLTILQDGVPVLDEALNTEKEKWLVKRFGDLEYFKKFRMIDMKQGINVLDEGKTALRKILISFHESILNNIREALQKKKGLYERYNKDTAVIFKHYPSMKRFNILKNKLSTVAKEQSELASEIQTLDSGYYNLGNKKGSLENTISYQLNQKRKIENNPHCPTCHQKFPDNLRKRSIEESLAIIEQAQKQLIELKDDIEGQKSAMQYVKGIYSKIQESITKVNYYATRLDARLKQKEYVYTNRDIALVTNALKELDKFYSYYILTSVKNLEPIINSIISKIGFELSFRLSPKGDFDLLLTKDQDEYSYKELSSGQRLMLSIAFQLSLLLDKGDTGLILADEGFNNLDTESMASLYEMLKELPFQIISVVHRFEDTSRQIHVIDLNRGDKNE